MAWLQAYVATSVALGEPADAFVASLGGVDAERARACLAAWEPLTRRARAEALATQLAFVLRDVACAEVRWR